MACIFYEEIPRFFHRMEHQSDDLHERFAALFLGGSGAIGPSPVQQEFNFGAAAEEDDDNNNNNNSHQNNNGMDY